VDNSRVATIEDFYRRRLLYRMTASGEAAEIGLAGPSWRTTALYSFCMSTLYPAPRRAIVEYHRHLSNTARAHLARS
jgi:hypothetical protein